MAKTANPKPNKQNLAEENEFDKINEERVLQHQILVGSQALQLELKLVFELKRRDSRRTLNLCSIYAIFESKTCDFECLNSSKSPILYFLYFLGSFTWVPPPSMKSSVAIYIQK